MPEKPELEVMAAHRFFSSACFNRAWDLIDKEERTEAETDDMIQLAHVSTWHWRQRPDCTKDKLSIGYWQLSRVYALAGDTARATRYGELSLAASEGEAPFLGAYAYEALARAASVAGDGRQAAAYLGKARQLLEIVQDEEERALVQKDIDSIQP